MQFFQYLPLHSLFPPCVVIIFKHGLFQHYYHQNSITLTSCSKSWDPAIEAMITHESAILSWTMSTNLILKWSTHYNTTPWLVIYCWQPTQIQYTLLPKWLILPTTKTFFNMPIQTHYHWINSWLYIHYPLCQQISTKLPTYNTSPVFSTPSFYKSYII